MTHLLWYATRATGIVALVLLTATVMMGIIGTARAESQRWPRLVTAGLHRNLALTAAALVAVHVITTVLDPFASISLAAAFIPFSSAYRPLWLSLGAVAFDLLLAVLITSLLRDRLGRRGWQAVHMLVYLCWPVALWHGLGTGTDTKLPFVLAIDVACLAGVGWAAWKRLSLTDHPIARPTGLVALAAGPALTVVFVATGPLRPGWASRAGTPPTLLRPRPAVALASSARFTGHIAVTNGPAAGERTITITGRTQSAPAEPIRIVLRGRPSGGGVALTGGTARIGGYSGPVVRLAGSDLVAEVTGPAGQRRASFLLTISGTVVDGTVSLR